jgi:hypothetical protein
MGNEADLGFRTLAHAVRRGSVPVPEGADNMGTEFFPSLRVRAAVPARLLEGVGTSPAFFFGFERSSDRGSPSGPLGGFTIGDRSIVFSPLEDHAKGPGARTSRRRHVLGRGGCAYRGLETAEAGTCGARS